MNVSLIPTAMTIGNYEIVTKKSRKKRTPGRRMALLVLSLLEALVAGAVRFVKFVLVEPVALLVLGLLSLALTLRYFGIAIPLR